MLAVLLRYLTQANQHMQALWLAHSHTYHLLNKKTDSAPETTSNAQICSFLLPAPNLQSISQASSIISAFWA